LKAEDYDPAILYNTFEPAQQQKFLISEDARDGLENAFGDGSKPLKLVAFAELNGAPGRLGGRESESQMLAKEQSGLL